MTGDEVQALLDRLEERGTVAWWVSGPDGDAAPGAPTRVAVDVSGLDPAVRLLVARGFVADLADLPASVALTHPRVGRLEVLALAVGADGGARWPQADGTEHRVPAAAFDPVATRPRRLRFPQAAEGNQRPGPTRV